MHGAQDVIATKSGRRDRYVDFLRAFSVVVVIVGHWVVAGVVIDEGVVRSTSSIISMSDWAWALTWLLQVIPLFFFVGGFSNFVSYRSSRRRGLSTGTWIRSRLSRLLKPTAVFLGIWVAIQLVLHVAEIGAPTRLLLRGMHPPGATIPFGPLWFIPAYAGVILLAPMMLRLHERFGLAVPAVLVAGGVVADTFRFGGGVPRAGWGTAIVIAVLPHQLGFFYADGHLTRLPRKALLTMAASGLAALILFTNPWVFGSMGDGWFPGTGHYPRSLVGGEEGLSNISPPTVCLVAAAFLHIGAAMLLRGLISRWLDRERPWRIVVGVNMAIMTLFLWHMTALLLAGLVLWPLGFGRASAGTLAFWVERPLWLGLAAAILVWLAKLLRVAERPPIPAPAAVLEVRARS